jgi:hypothetical protein
MLYAVLEEAEGAVVKVEQHAHTVALLVAACTIGINLLAVAAEGTIVSEHEPAIVTSRAEESCRVEVGPADANEDAVHILRQQLHLPKVLALSKLGFGSYQ